MKKNPALQSFLHFNKICSSTYTPGKYICIYTLSLGRSFISGASVKTSSPAFHLTCFEVALKHASRWGKSYQKISPETKHGETPHRNWDKRRTNVNLLHPPKFNIAPKISCLEDDAFLLGFGPFSGGELLNFQGVMLQNDCQLGFRPCDPLRNKRNDRNKNWHTCWPTLHISKTTSINL